MFSRDGQKNVLWHIKASKSSKSSKSKDCTKIAQIPVFVQILFSLKYLCDAQIFVLRKLFAPSPAQSLDIHEGVMS